MVVGCFGQDRRDHAFHIFVHLIIATAQGVSLCATFPSIAFTKLSNGKGTFTTWQQIWPLGAFTVICYFHEALIAVISIVTLRTAHKCGTCG